MIIPDTIYANRLGLQYQIVRFDHRTPKGNYFEVRFLKTGYTKVASMTDISHGRIKDRLAKSVAGIGYWGIDDVPYRSTSRMYRIWHNMINRCYNPNSSEYYHYGACGVTVCERWHSFTKFALDIPTLEGYNAKEFENNEICLDKDYKQFKRNCKVYSPETCVFVSPLINGWMIDREHKEIYSISPKGEREDWKSVAEFRIYHPEIPLSSIYKCLSKNMKSTRNWRFMYCNDYRKPARSE